MSQISEPTKIEIKPYGLVPGLSEERPVLIFKSLDEKVSVAVPLSPLDAGISVAQSHGVGTSSSPHKLALTIIEELGCEVDYCLIKEVKGHHVFVDVCLVSPDDEKKEICFSSRADEAISFCLQAGATFYVLNDVISTLKELEVDKQMSAKPPVASFGFESKKHPYLM